MVNCSVMAGSAPKPPELTWMVATPVPGMLKFMVSAPEVALACWMAALKVHWFPSLKTSMSQVPLAVDASGESRVSLTTKVVAAWTAGAGMRLIAIIPATKRPAASALVLFLIPIRCLMFVLTVISFLPLFLWEARSLRRGFLCPGVSLGRGGGCYIVRTTYLGHLFLREARRGRLGRFRTHIGIGLLLGVSEAVRVRPREALLPRTPSPRSSVCTIAPVRWAASISRVVAPLRVATARYMT